MTTLNKIQLGTILEAYFTGLELAEIATQKGKTWQVERYLSRLLNISNKYGFGFSMIRAQEYLRRAEENKLNKELDQCERALAKKSSLGKRRPVYYPIDENNIVEISLAGKVDV